MAGAIAVPEMASSYGQLREVAEVVGREFRKELALVQRDPLVRYDPDAVDAIYALLHRGVIEVGPGA
jgi:hypothetical protein